MTQSKPSIVDVSHWQAGVDFPTLKATGILGVILKATEGVSYVDDTFKGRRLRAQDAGLVVSTYHFLKAGSVQGQMAHYLNTVAPDQGERVVIDVEDEALKLNDVHVAVQTLLNAGKNLQITIYGGSLIKQMLGSSKDDFLAQNTSLWLAQYTSGNPSWPKQVWPNWSLWQYSDKGSVRGITGACDVNLFNGSDENCLKWLGPAPRPAPPPEEPVQPDADGVPLVTVSLSAEQPVRIRLALGANVSLEQ